MKSKINTHISFQSNIKNKDYHSGSIEFLKESNENKFEIFKDTLHKKELEEKQRNKKKNKEISKL